MKKRIYISGKIGNTHNSHVRPKFNSAAQQLAAVGFTPVNPLDNGLPADAPWIEHIITDLQLMKTCHGMYRLPDWTESDGARIESLFAEQLWPPHEIINQPCHLAYQQDNELK